MNIATTTLCLRVVFDLILSKSIHNSHLLLLKFFSSYDKKSAIKVIAHFLASIDGSGYFRTSNRDFWDWVSLGGSGSSVEQPLGSPLSENEAMLQMSDVIYLAGQLPCSSCIIMIAYMITS